MAPQEAPRGNPEGTKEAPTVGFPPSLGADPCICLYILEKITPKGKENTRRRPKESKDLQGWPKKRPRDTLGAKRAPHKSKGMPKGRPKKPQSQPKAPKGRPKEPSGPPSGTQDTPKETGCKKLKR